MKYIGFSCNELDGSFNQALAGYNIEAGVAGFCQGETMLLETKSAAHGNGMGERGNRISILGDLVVELVSLVECVSRKDILAKKRGMFAISHARQLVMYLLHTSLRFSYQDVAGWMNKDRTTISHACNVIEDMRDNPALDSKLERIETILLKTRELTNV